MIDILPKVLIVDDKKDIRLFIKMTLEKSAKYTFFEASNGQEGVELAIRHSPHIILMDGIMPIMDGFEAIEILRNNPETKNIPIIMVSKLDTKDEKIKALKSGISDFISKPFDKTELAIRVNSLLHLYLKYTEEKEQLEDINSHLEAKVNEKLESKLTDIRLSSIGQMATAITHELNTPVTYMKSNLELLRYDIEDIEENQKIKESMLKILDTLDNGIERVKGIIDTTRDLSKKSDNKKSVNNIYERIIIASRMIYTRAKHQSDIYINGKKFDLNLATDTEVFNANVFKSKLDQVWIIILNNACDEFEKSDLEFEKRKIFIDMSFNDKGKLCITFKDNAKGGIDEKVLPNIFEPFISTKENSGIGVGLNIAKEIVTLHSGKIEAFNEDGFAVFKIEI